MPRIDHHIHTSRHSPDSVIDPHDMIERALAVGLDGVVITEHDYQWRADELQDLQSHAGGLLVLAGVEVSAREGHFLVYGLPNLDHVTPGIALRELIGLVRREKAAIVAAHPFRWDQDFDAIVSEHGPAFDALEVVSNNVFPENRVRTHAVATRHRLGATGSSDAHQVNVVGCYHTEFADPIRSMADFVAALKSRRYRPRHLIGTDVCLASGPVDETD